MTYLLGGEITEEIADHLIDAMPSFSVYQLTVMTRSILSVTARHHSQNRRTKISNLKKAFVKSCTEKVNKSVGCMKRNFCNVICLCLHWDFKSHLYELFNCFCSGRRWTILTTFLSFLIWLKRQKTKNSSKWGYLGSGRFWTGEKTRETSFG